MLGTLNLGALGYVPKSVTHEFMVNALRLVFSGGIYIPPEILLHGGEDADQPQPARPPAPADLGLTERQLDVLGLMVIRYLCGIFENPRSLKSQPGWRPKNSVLLRYMTR